MGFRLWLVVFLAFVSVCASGQSLDFESTVYFTASGTSLKSSDTTLASFDFTTASRTHPLFNDGLYYPVVDVSGNNLWVRVRHIADDPNGISFGHQVDATQSSPFRNGGFGGWWGFLYQFDIFSDVKVTGQRSNTIAGSFETTILVESIETLSYPEWVDFQITKNPGSAWVLNSIDFTGSNPGSNPGFSGAITAYDSPDFTTTFPSNSNVVSVIDLDGGAFSEFSMSANHVSQFKYGYEYSSAGGYQGMRLSFGTAAIAPTITSFSPPSGPAGTVVTIIGMNFDPTPENNIVKINGVTAVVTASSTTSITIVVPSNATSGPITVTIGLDTATSASSFIVTGPSALVIWNGVSPNDDNYNDTFIIENIEAFEETRSNTVTIFNRWGDKIFTTHDYNNTTSVFKGESTGGSKLPAGIYYYEIVFATGKPLTGYLTVKY